MHNRFSVLVLMFGPMHVLFLVYSFVGECPQGPGGNLTCARGAREPPLLPAGTCPPQFLWEIAESWGKLPGKVSPLGWWLCNFKFRFYLFFLVSFRLVG